MALRNALLAWAAGRRPIVPAIRLSGIIGAVGWRGAGLTLAGLEKVLERAFALGRAPAVALLVNSPGGTPVQASLIAGRIRLLAEEKRRPVLAFVEDVAASGGYWLACAADEIFADASSVVGSIGVISASFGVPDAIARLGVERRVHASGPHKAMLDPFQPERVEDLERLGGIQGAIHEAFKAHVRARRGARLKAPEEDLFDGRIWAGSEAVALGLIDGLGDAHSVIRQRFGREARLVTFARPRSWLQRRLNLEVAALAGEVGHLLEERLLWRRYGL
jgi:signal peptide peptidase SppA